MTAEMAVAEVVVQTQDHTGAKIHSIGQVQRGRQLQLKICTGHVCCIYRNDGKKRRQLSQRVSHITSERHVLVDKIATYAEKLL